MNSSEFKPSVFAAAIIVGLSAMMLGPVRADDRLVFSDFRDLTGFTLNGNAADLATDETRNDALRLTNDLWQGGSAFLTETISIADDASFSTYFRFQITNPLGMSGEVQGADGIVFIVQTKSSEVGAVGGGIGYEGLEPSVGVEFDTWWNGHDPDGNHVGIGLNGNMSSVVTEHVEPPFNNGEIWHAWVEYDGRTDMLEARWSRDADRPGDPMLAHQVDLVEVLGRSDVFLGFSAGTGAAGNTHDILSWRFVGDYEPIGTPAASGSLLLSAEATSPIAAPRQVALILDASGSIWGQLEDGVAKIEVAKQVMGDLIRVLPDDIQIGFRVYGHRYNRSPKSRSCTDTELVVPFGPIDRSALLAAVGTITPRGQTPIGLSLSKLSEDFAGVPGAKLVVLVTDGIETCSPDPGTEHYPPAVVQSLIDRGYDIRVNVVGFDIESSATRAFLQGLAAQSGGVYFDAGDAGQLSSSLAGAFSGNVPFTIEDANGTAVGTGEVNGDPVVLAPGRYSVLLSVQGELRVLRNVDVAAGEDLRLIVTGWRGNELLVERGDGG